MALVYGAVQSPVFDELKHRARMVQHDGTQRPQDYDLVIFDGDAHDAGAVQRDPLIAQALASGVWVLGLDLSTAHKRDGLGALLDFSSGGASPGYFVRTEHDRNGREVVTVLEYPKVGVTVYHSGGVPGALQAPQHTASTASGPTPAATAAFVDRVLEKVAGGPTTVRAQQVGGPQFPAGLLYKTFIHDKPLLLTSPGPHQNANPAPTQTGTYTLTATTSVFLDNRNEPQGNFQYVLTELDGEANPTNGSNVFANMNYDEKAYFQDRYLMRVWPKDDALFLPVGTAPETANNVTQVTSNVGFTIGFTQAGEAPSPGASFSYSNAQTRNITDWKVTNESAGNRAGWYYRSENPWSVDDWYNQVDPYNGFYWTSYPAQPNDLALNQLQVHAQAVWRTQNVLNSWVEFDTHREYQLIDLYCSRDFGYVCIGRRQADWADGSDDDSFQINLGAVVPVPIQSLTFNPNPVKAGQPATGTVTLTRPAQTDTVIQLSSNNPNATVLPTVTVKQGQTTATFQILTSANGLNPGGSTVATVTAFYAENVQAQLTIQN